VSPRKEKRGGSRSRRARSGVPADRSAPTAPAGRRGAKKLSPGAIDAVDSGEMVADVLDQPAQLTDALWRVESAGIAPRDAPGGLIVCGMGGSGVGGDLAAAAIGPRATRPIRTIRDYAPDPWLGDDTLVLLSSYSGDTEEALACFDAAGAAGAPRVALTTGGELAERARAEDVPVIGVPAGLQPRAAVAYTTVGALECAALCGAAPVLRAEVEAASAVLSDLASQWGPEAPGDSEAKVLAARLHGSLPVVYGAGATAPVAVRWKTQFNENAKLPAFAAELPEADHNEICAWEGAGHVAPLLAVFLEDRDQHPRVSARIELTAEFVEASGAPSVRVATRGETALERVLSLVLLGDLVSVYLAVLGGTDPTPVEAIDRLKDRLD
jgi:glucose/mannose-6-phosphate isomerase